MELPFWRNGFVLDDPKNIDSILASSIKKVWIDSAKSVGGAPGEIAVSEADSEAHVDADLAPVVLDRRNVNPLSTAPELEHASKICLQAKRAVISMLEEARMGKAVETGGAKKLLEEITDSVERNPAVIPMEILNKPGKLSQVEWGIVKQHPIEGHRLLLTGSELAPVVLDVCLHHHEKTDGSGYPDLWSGIPS